MVAYPLVDRFGSKSDAATELYVRNPAGSNLRVDPVGAHAEHARDVVGGEQTAGHRSRSASKPLRSSAWPIV